MSYSIEKIASLLGVEIYGGREGSVSFLLTDSRSLCFPEETLFFSLRTERGDGHNYISELYARGVSFFVVEELPCEWEKLYSQASFLKVSSSKRALQRLAACHRDEFHIPVVGVTGSNGKTVVKEWLYQLLSLSKRVTRSPRSYNSQIGVPLSVWLLNEQTQVGIFEAGISKKGEMEVLRNIIKPTIGVLTSLGDAHQENFVSMEEKCREKLRLFTDVDALVYPYDDKLIRSCVDTFSFKGKKLGWSVKDTSVSLFIKDIKKSELSTTITYIWTQEKEDSYTIPFIDDASIDDSVTCLALCLYLGIKKEVLKARMPLLEPVAMRLEVKEGQRGCTLINDSYNSDINSLDIALDFMNRRPDHKGRKRTLVLSDILQSAEDDEALYRRVASLAEKRGVEKFVGIGETLICHRKAFDNIKDRCFFATVGGFLSSDVFRQMHDEVILLKGACCFGFEQLTEMLVNKVHETVLEVNLNAIVDNLNWYRSLMKPQTKLVCMIKADAYGAGSVEIAKTLQDHRVDYLAVAVADEGVTLRKNGITNNVMIMNPEMSSFKTLFDFDLEPEVYSFRLLEALIKAAEKEGITGFPVHIKIDTGMHRLGFDPVKDIDELIHRLQRQSAIIPRSVFSHFVGSDSDSFDDFSSQQFALFKQGADKLQGAFPHKILFHMDNSAGIEHFPYRQMDMCRLGLGLYGINPRSNKCFNTISELKTTILQIRNVPKGDTVGYSRKGVISHDSMIAAIPIGYADGLNRHLGNRRGYCLVNGKKAEYVGNICMDVAMIDVTGIDCKEGDQVEIFGKNLPVTVLSDILDTIPYEVLTNVSNRVKRVYFQD